MSRSSKFGVEGLRSDKAGFFYEYCEVVEGIKNKKRIRLGHVSKEEALIYVERVRKGAKEGKPPAEIRVKALTFNEAADSFLADSRLRKKSYSRDEIYIRYLKEYFGTRSVEGLNHEAVTGFLKWRCDKRTEAKKPPLSNTTKNHDLRCLKTIVRRAWLNGHVSRNPLQGFKLFKEIPRDRVVEPEDFRKLLDVSPPHLKAILLFGFFTGTRIGEARTLRWSQVNLKKRIIILEAEDTKTQEKREVPLTESLVEMLKKIPRSLATPYVFTYKGKPLKTIRTAFRNACRKAGLDGLHYHDLRHAFVTFCKRSGVGESTIMSIAGIRTSAIFRRYNRVDTSDRLEAVDRLSAWTGLETDKRPNAEQSVS